MPPKLRDDNSSAPNDPRNRSSRRGLHVNEVQQPGNAPLHTMATQTQSPGYWHHSAIPQMPERTDRMRLPPLLQSRNATLPSSPLTTGPPPPMSVSALISPTRQDLSPQGIPQGPYTPSGNRQVYQGYFPPPERLHTTHNTPVSPDGSSTTSRNTQPEPLIPLKRRHDGFPYSVRPPPPLSVVTPSSSDHSSTYARNNLPPLSAQSSISNTSTPTGKSASFTLPGPTSTSSRPPSEVSSNTIMHRCSLHIRQQPRAARAGPDGKDRRNVDPPPILQLLLTDFSPNSTTDISELKSNHYVVHCKLISAESPRRDVTTHTTVSEDGSRETSRLLLGTNVASPFFCTDDPDIENMPQHPRTETEDLPESPSSRFFPSRRSSPPLPPQPSSSTFTDAPSSLPCAFFIFADLSVRRAGSYRLEFTLMKIDPAAMNLPMIDVACSNVFRVVNAKDFDQVHPSTRLVRGLLERGAPFPLKLKKGIREGQRRRTNLVDADGGEEGSMEGSLVGEGEEGDGLG